MKQTFHDKAISRGYMRKELPHLAFRFGLYKLFGLAFLVHFVWQVASSV